MIRPAALVRVVLALGVVATTSLVAGSTPVGAVEPAGYEPLPAPQRLLDTRRGEPTVDDRFAGIGKRAARSSVAIDVAGRAGLAEELGSVVLNVTVDAPEAAGFVTVWPCDESRPTASNVNYAPGQVVGTAAITRVAADGRICLYTLAAAHLVVDVAGHFPVGSFEPLRAPERLADTRPGEPTVDDEFAGDGKLAAGDVYELQVAGRGTVPPGATAAALSVTVTDVDEPGFLTVFPCDVRRPTASTVNYSPGLTTPNAAITRLDPTGKVCLFTLRPVHLVVDAAGTIATPFFEPLPQPRRLLDTRVGEPTFDGDFTGGGVQPFGATLQLDVGGRAGVPADATAVVLNVTSTASSSPGFVTAHPDGSSRPGASNLNYVDGRTVANLTIAALGPAGDVCLFNLGATHLVVDVAGWLTGPATPTAEPQSAPCPGRTPDRNTTSYRNEILRRPGLHGTVGVDRIGVYICRIPTDSRPFDGADQHDTTAEEFAEFARQEVAPYFEEVSGGWYTTEFTALGDIVVGRDATSSTCLEEATRRTGAPFTNVLVAGSVRGGGGFASPGSIFTSPLGPDVTVFERPPSESGRGGWLGGSTVSFLPNPGTIVHEIGHTLHWPHSFIGPDSEYDNPVDIMSGGEGLCRVDRTLYPCIPGNTMAFNRLASGWLRNGQVVTHPSGTANYRLAPPGSRGLQLVAVPDPDEPLSSLTIEARPAIGNDDFFERDGVALHVVDQINRTGRLSGLSTGRLHRQATGDPDSFDHVIDVGGSLTIRGVTVEVLRRDGDHYDVRVTGTYDAPGLSFFTESVDALARTSCATMPLADAFAAGCTR